MHSQYLVLQSKHIQVRQAIRASLPGFRERHPEQGNIEDQKRPIELAGGKLFEADALWQVRVNKTLIPSKRIPELKSIDFLLSACWPMMDGWEWVFRKA